MRSKREQEMTGQEIVAQDAIQPNGAAAQDEEPDWKAAFSGVLKQRNEWMNRAQNLELDMFLMEEKIKKLTEEMAQAKASASSTRISANEASQKDTVQ